MKGTTMSSLTYAEVLGRHNTAVPAHLEAQAAVPVHVGPQRQGDVLIIPRARLGSAERAVMAPVPAAGIAVVRGESATGGNSHILQALDGPCSWSAGGAGLLFLGVLDVPVGSTAYLSHTEEHGALAVGPGTYVLHGKREQAAEIRRVAD
jgi:hypothetical protein